MTAGLFLPVVNASAAPAKKTVQKAKVVYAEPAKAAQRAPASKHITKLPPKIVKRPAPTEAAPKEASNASVGKLVRNVRATDPLTGVVLGEVAGLAAADNYVLLPLVFVSDVSLSKANVHFFVDDEDGRVSQELVLSDLDLDAGIALFKAANRITPSLALNKIREALPVSQEALVSVTAPDVVIPGAKFLRSKKDVSALRFQIATGAALAANQADYIFDRSGNLVAVATGSSDGGGVWSGSSHSIMGLMKKRSPANVASGLDARHRQLFAWQDRWAQALNPSKKGLSLRFMDCQAHNAKIVSEKIAGQVQKLEAKACESRFSLPLGGGYEAGIQVQLGEAFIKPSSSFERNREQSLAQLSGAFASTIFDDFSRSIASVNQFTTSDCKDSQVTNGSGQNVIVHYCTSALKGETGLNDTSISVSALDSSWRGTGSHAYLSAVRLKGFGEAQTRKVLEAMIENPQEAR